MADYLDFLASKWMSKIAKNISNFRYCDNDPRLPWKFYISCNKRRGKSCYWKIRLKLTEMMTFGNT